MYSCCVDGTPSSVHPCGPRSVQKEPSYLSPSQVMELKNKCDAVEKRETEKRQLEEKKHQEELQALKKTNQQLKVQPHKPKLTASFLGLHHGLLSPAVYFQAFSTLLILQAAKQGLNLVETQDFHI